MAYSYTFQPLAHRYPAKSVYQLGNHRRNGSNLPQRKALKTKSAGKERWYMTKQAGSGYQSGAIRARIKKVMINGLSRLTRRRRGRLVSLVMGELKEEE